MSEKLDAVPEAELMMEDWRDLAMTLQMALGHVAARMVPAPATPEAVDRLASRMLKTAVVTVNVMTQQEKADCLDQLRTFFRQFLKP